MKKVLIIALMLIAGWQAMAQKAAYKIFSSEGQKLSYEQMLQASLDKDVVLFGELHNNPISHWLQLELAKGLYAKTMNDTTRSLALGAEMFERDDQIIIDEYFQGKISTRNFEGQARLWPNYSTDYKPLIEMAKKKGLPFFATNIPRRYASMVAASGFEALDSLDSKAWQWMAPLPVPYDPQLPGYKAMLNMGGMGHEPNENLPKAQAIKDATMAHFILKNAPENGLFVHFHGTYHSNNYEGIYWYLKGYQPEVSILTIASVEQENLDELEERHLEMADFIVVIPQTMTKTY